MNYHGAVAGGHPETVNAAELVLREGGNAFDAVIAAHFAACVVEPVLASLGGGGYLTFKDHRGNTGVYDFFVQTPRSKSRLDELDFYPIHADFGTATQEFHLGRASIATPGTIRGLFEIHKDLGSMPMRQLIEPAVALAKNGVVLNAFQAYIFSIIQPIYLVDAQSRSLFANDNGDTLLGEGQRYSMPAFADVLEALAYEGEALFYRGEIAQMIAAIGADGGCLTRADLENYQVIKRRPLLCRYHDHQIALNPLPSSGGSLIYFALQLLSDYRPGECSFGSYEHLALMALVMELTNEARVSAEENGGLASLAEDELLARFRREMKRRAHARRGTTHISVVDKNRNAAAMTVSNGEGCGHMIPGTGIMLNNMLGEEDLNPNGFHRWQTDQRMTSMMSPCLLSDKAGNITALGSGGSNRIRTTLLQVLVNLIDFGLPLEQAIHAPRIHLEGRRLNIEGGIREDVVAKLTRDYSDHVLWPEHNLFFGGAHGVSQGEKGVIAEGDPRRGGCSRVI